MISNHFIKTDHYLMHRDEQFVVRTALLSSVKGVTPRIKLMQLLIDAFPEEINLRDERGYYF